MKSFLELLRFPYEDHKDVPNVALALAVTAALISFGLNLRTIHPGVGPTVDSIELQIASWVGGIIHPPGSPQYLVLGSIVMRVFPGPNPAFRLNLFSSLCIAAMIGVVFLINYRLTRNLYVSSFASMMLALAPRIWFQGSVSELYGLNALYVALFIYFLILWSQSLRPIGFWAATVIYAISFGNHLSMILLLPAYLYIVSDTAPRMLFSRRNFIIVLGIVLLSMLQYAYIPLRAAANPSFCNYCPGLLPNPVRYITGPFADYITGGPFKGAMFGLTVRDAMARIPDAIGAFNRQFLPWGYILGIIGGWELFRRQVSLAWLLTLGIIANFVFVIGYDIPDWYDFLTPAYVMFAPLIAYGSLRIWEITEPIIRGYIRAGKLWGWVYPTSLIVGMLFALAVAFFTHLPYVDQSGHTAFNQGTRAVLLQIEDDDSAFLLMPSALASSFYYSWAFEYQSLVQDIPLQVIASPELIPPPGPPPAYLPWAEIASQIEGENIAQFLASAGRRVFLVDAADPRAALWGLLPICTPESSQIAGYEVVALRSGENTRPLVDSSRWSEIENRVVFGEIGTCA